MLNTFKTNLIANLLYFYYKFSLPTTTNKMGKAKNDAKLLLDLPRANFLNGLKILTISKSQIRQDLMVLSTLDFKKNGFFVEFGATNGIDLSNTHLLEKHFGWRGILAEPAMIWHQDLLKNRNCFIEKSCVWSQSGSILSFNEVDIPEVSTITQFNGVDEHSNSRESGTHYAVSTISLNDLLEKYNAPVDIDFLSIDTEGSEFEILNALNFSKYNIKIICCEHNHTSMREKIYSLLISHGYIRKYEDHSMMDDWFFKL
jgi:FkbM family methyltransferase